MKVNNKVIVVTGGGGGLGRALVLHLLEKGAKVAAIDINQDALEETKSLSGKFNSNLSIHNLNITNWEKVNGFPEEVIKIHGAVDGLINNAGIIQPFIHVDKLGMDKIEQIMNVNFYGSLYLVKAFLPYFLERLEGHIVNVSSLGGFMPFPGQTIYGASKAAIKLLTEGLYAELKDTNVRATVIHPGAIKTNIMANSGLKNSVDPETSKDSKMALEPEKAATMIIKAMEKNKYRATVGKDSTMLDILYRISPRLASNIIIKQMKGIELPQS
ncbi:SDR family NAD(P)-dependent oxidoreductase [Aestuariibaculum lutulentum]|uniref:SDR family NAD(P)-dependent oxidoreductase n=1 Tax=Aestuariibaculum lutulentum TaxID=2920935 RepID=A0ABS9RKE3_9FLAO|nr:SDR family NAD(P)-dependent oxidoreductase [Aestuariibaculum lutulentum]MCH4553431.1 SDR family NAD(P)-dependent oxidoreductase [Aestuariibaculum lutulentum]